MRLYLLRHAKAYAPGSAKFPRDSERPLTPGGEKKMRVIARGMKRLGLGLELILTSPYARAKRTAEIAAQTLRKTAKLKESIHLAADGDPARLIAEIAAKHASAKSIMLVGHQPYLGNLMSMLLAGDPRVEFNLKKAGLAQLTIEQLVWGRCASLDWLLTPRQLTEL